MQGRELLIDTYPHIPPVHAIAALTPEAAERRLPSTDHSIADLVAHMAFWQEWFLQRCQGVAEPIAAPASRGWPEVQPGSGPAVHDRFVSGLARIAALLDRGDEVVTPAIEFPPLAHYTVRDAVVHVAQHNSHHVGQVVLLRQLMGLWPPPSGGWTW
jgi:uncharacterized damage-inducible protein DinB